MVMDRKFPTTSRCF